MSKKSKTDKKIANAPVNGMVTDLTIEHVQRDGYGVATMGEYAILIQDCAAGDVVTVRIDHVSKQAPTAWGRIFSVLERGPHWKKHFCKKAVQSFGHCGGCPFGHVTRDVYRAAKIQGVADDFAAAELSVPIPELHCGSSTHYRNKSNFVVNKKKNGEVHLGSFAPRSHRFASMSGCKINGHPISKVQHAVESILTEKEVPVYPETGGIRYVTVKKFESGATLVDVVVHNDDASPYQGMLDALLDIDAVHGVTVTCNTGTGNQIRTEIPTLRGGKKTLLETVGEISLWMSASTFFQLNNDIARTMYEQTATWCKGAEVIWDLYCGIGGLGLTAAKHSEASLFGCDNVTESIQLAEKNAVASHLDATFKTIDLAHTMPTEWPSPNVILTNPPRKGMDASLLRHLCKNPSDQLIYMSCNAASFAQDARTLCNNEYHLEEIKLYDMLPNTAHVELLGRFTRLTS